MARRHSLQRWRSRSMVRTKCTVQACCHLERSSLTYGPPHAGGADPTKKKVRGKKRKAAGPEVSVQYTPRMLHSPSQYRRSSRKDLSIVATLFWKALRRLSLQSRLLLEQRRSQQRRPPQARLLRKSPPPAGAQRTARPRRMGMRRSALHAISMHACMPCHCSSARAPGIGVG